jgi:hypothetical protein
VEEMRNTGNDRGRFGWRNQKGSSIAELKNHALSFDKATKEEIFFGSEMKKSEKFQMVVNSTTQKDVVAVSKDYNLLNHADVINAVSDALLNLNINGRCSSTSYGNKMFVDIQFPDIEFDMKVGENFLGGMRIINSYDKTTGIMVLPQLTRVACSNGMVFSSAWVDSINIRHTSKLVHEFEKEVPRLIKSMVDGCDKFKAMVEKSMIDSVEWELLTKILPALVKQEKYREAIADRLRQDHPDGSAYSRWELYNSVTFVCSHDQQLRPTIEHSLQGIAERILVTPFAEMPKQKEEVEA